MRIKSSSLCSVFSMLVFAGLGHRSLAQQSMENDQRQTRAEDSVNDKKENPESDGAFSHSELGRLLDEFETNHGRVHSFRLHAAHANTIFARQRPLQDEKSVATTWGKWGDLIYDNSIPRAEWQRQNQRETYLRPPKGLTKNPSRRRSEEEQKEVRPFESETPLLVLIATDHTVLHLFVILSCLLLVIASRCSVLESCALTRKDGVCWLHRWSNGGKSIRGCRTRLTIKQI
mmetsp:Transcript_17155/g.37437  ORF Transcript_17155/g.37437 Transcript_17155/m.37437 type:complete len:231 (-) Transcript_17155:83-775(-)